MGSEVQGRLDSRKSCWDPGPLLFCVFAIHPVCSHTPGGVHGTKKQDGDYRNTQSKDTSSEVLHIVSARFYSSDPGPMEWSVFCCCNKIPEASYFVKKRGSFSSQFERVGVPGQAGLPMWPLVRAQW